VELLPAGDRSRHQRSLTDACMPGKRKEKTQVWETAPVIMGAKAH
jgi:hypothetical protein